MSVAYIIDFYDEGNRYLRGHSNARRKLYKDDDVFEFKMYEKIGEV